MAAPPARRVSVQTVILVVIGLTLINVGVVSVSWKKNTGVEETLTEIGREVARTTAEIREEAGETLRTVETLTAPIAAPDPERFEGFRAVESELEQGDYSEARRRLYALLAIVDRLDPEVRGDAEARAGFLLADSYRLEAFEKLAAAGEETP